MKQLTIGQARTLGKDMIAKDMDDALDAAEARLAPQIDLPECSIYGSEVQHACE